ncbi:MAG: GNAT family N-acetyltransferase [Sphingomicrobium sp.]
MADEIRTERLVLRRARTDDLAAMHGIMSQAAAMRYWSTPPHGAVDDTRKWLESMIAVDPALSDDFIVTLDGLCIGKLGAWRLPDVGFLIDPAQWGRGYASEALVAFIERRRRLDSAELTADVDPRNQASLRLLERHGFVETHRAAGTWQVGDELCDSVYLRLAL